jgi:hypothetical protein
MIYFVLQVSTNLSNALFIEHRGYDDKIEDKMKVHFQTILATKFIRIRKKCLALECR